MNRFVLADTNFLISLYNEGMFLEEYAEIVKGHIMRYSAVVLNEFLRGAHDKTSRKIAAELLILAGGRILTPSERHWAACGRISQLFLKGGKKTREEVNLLQNDILIALSVREIGGTLLTRDRGDFSAIQKYVKFDCVYF